MLNAYVILMYEGEGRLLILLRFALMIGSVIMRNSSFDKVMVKRGITTLTIG